MIIDRYDNKRVRAPFLLFSFFACECDKIFIEISAGTIDFFYVPIIMCICSIAFINSNDYF